MHATVAWIEIPAADVVHSARFYERVFGWTVYPDPRVSGYERFLDRTGHLAGAFTTKGNPAGHGGVRVVIQVDDLRTCLDDIVAEGGTLVAGPSLEPEGSGLWASFQDPAGNVLNVYEGRDTL